MNGENIWKNTSDIPSCYCYHKDFEHISSAIENKLKIAFTYYISNLQDVVK